MQHMQNFYQQRTQPFLNGFSWNYISRHNFAVSQPFEVIFLWLFKWRGSNFFKISIFWVPWGKFMSIFELAENLILLIQPPRPPSPPSRPPTWKVSAPTLKPCNFTISHLKLGRWFFFWWLFTFRGSNLGSNFLPPQLWVELITLIGLDSITDHNSADSQLFEVKFFLMTFYI